MNLISSLYNTVAHVGRTISSPFIQTATSSARACSNFGGRMITLFGEKNGVVHKYQCVFGLANLDTLGKYLINSPQTIRHNLNRFAFKGTPPPLATTSQVIPVAEKILAGSPAPESPLSHLLNVTADKVIHTPNVAQPSYQSYTMNMNSVFPTSFYNKEFGADVRAMNQKLGNEGLNNLEGYNLNADELKSIKNDVKKHFITSVKKDVRDIAAKKHVKSNTLSLTEVAFNPNKPFVENFLTKVEHDLSLRFKQHPQAKEMIATIRANLNEIILQKGSPIYHSVQTFSDSYDALKLESETSIPALYAKQKEEVLTKEERKEIVFLISEFNKKATRLQSSFNNSFSQVEKGVLNKLREKNDITDKSLAALRNNTTKAAESGMAKAYESIQANHERLLPFKEAKSETNHEEIRLLKKSIKDFMAPTVTVRQSAEMLRTVKAYAAVWDVKFSD